MDHELRTQVDTLRAQGQELEAGKLLFERIPATQQPFWAARVLKIVSNKVGTCPWEVAHAIHVAETPPLWKDGHEAFDLLRVRWLKLAGQWPKPQPTKRWFQFRSKPTAVHEERVPVDESLLNLIQFAELTAKVTYNATNPIGPFDEHSGWRIAPWAWWWTKTYENDPAFGQSIHDALWNA